MPEHLTGRHQLIELRGLIVTDAGRQHERLEGTRRQQHPAQLLDHAQHPIGAANRAADALPARQEAGILPGFDRFDLGPQAGQRTAPQQPQDFGIAEFRAGARGQELAFGDPPSPGEATQRVMRDRRADAEMRPEIREQEGGVGAGIPADQFAERIGDRFEEGHRQADGQGGAQGIAQSRGILRHGIPLLPGDPHDDHLPALDQFAERGR